MSLRVGRELDVVIARDVMGHTLVKNKKFGYIETTPKGDRPLRKYSKEVEAAWEVVEKLGISLLPINDGSWFAMLGPNKGWQNPAEFLTYLQAGNFKNAGAAVAETAPLAICLAATRVKENALMAERSSEAH